MKLSRTGTSVTRKTSCIIMSLDGSLSKYVILRDYANHKEIYKEVSIMIL